MALVGYPAIIGDHNVEEYWQKQRHVSPIWEMQCAARGLPIAGPSLPLGTIAQAAIERQSGLDILVGQGIYSEPAAWKRLNDPN